MRLTHRFGIPLAGLCLLTAHLAHADVLNYTASGVVMQVDNPFAQLPPGLSQATVGQTFTFNYAIDPASVGSGSAGDTSYFDAVLAANYAVGGARGDFAVAGSSVELFNNLGGFTGYFLSAGDTVGSDFTGTAASVSLVTLAYSDTGASLPYYHDTSLSNLPLSVGQANQEDDLVVSFTSYIHGIAQSFSEVDVGALSIKSDGAGATSAPEIDANCAVGALTLLLGSVLVLNGRYPRRRH